MYDSISMNQGAMSFSPTGEIASSRKKNSGDNNGQLMVPTFFEHQA
jgi:hypothetical protein